MAGHAAWDLPPQAHQQDLGLHLNGAEDVAVLLRAAEVLGVRAHVGATVLILRLVRLEQNRARAAACRFKTPRDDDIQSTAAARRAGELT